MKTKFKNPLVIAIMFSAFTASSHVQAATDCEKQYQTRIGYLADQLRTSIAVSAAHGAKKTILQDACAQMELKFEAAYKAYVACVASNRPVRTQIPQAQSKITTDGNGR